MRNLFFIFALVSTFGFSQNLQDSHYGTVGYIKADGTVEDAHYSTIGYIKTDGTVQNKHYSIIGYIKEDG
ncbi:MAG: hypothetical protein JNL60_02305, partial [Bacteroidia bacterium]|nr:hypothetical protein [Bacteroidia bacterium]